MCRKKDPGLKPKVHGLNQFSVEEESESEDDKHPDDDQNDSEDPEYVWTLKNEKLNSISVKINGQSVKVSSRFFFVQQGIKTSYLLHGRTKFTK